MPENPKAIIIGAGVAGMAAAIRLAVQGIDVQVFEKNPWPGGKLYAFEKNGFHFDAGPSLFTQPQNIEELFTLAGEPIEGYFNYTKVPVTCKYFYENGKVVNAFADKIAFAEEMEKVCGEKAEHVIEYLEKSEQVYENIGTIFLDYSLHKPAMILKAPLAKAFATARVPYLFYSLHKLNEMRFDTDEAVQLFDRYATYNGSNPYKAPGMLSLIPHLELNQGTFYPEGGMISITKALHALALKKGVKFHFNAKVDQIMYNNGRVIGVKVNGSESFSDVVVSNMDVYFTYKHLLQNPDKAKKLLKQERSSSAIIFYWGMKKAFPQLQLHNIFFSKNYKEEFDCLFKKGTLFDDPTVYINITSKMESGQAPEGKENWFVMVNAPANTGQDWDDLKRQCKQNVLSKLNRMFGDDIEELIETEHTLDPVMIEEQTASYMGSLYGTSSNSASAAFLRHPNFSAEIKGLYFAGGSVHPGGGIPLCLKSAKIVSELVQTDKEKLLKKI